MEEIWKDIKGYEGIYQVSSEGRVRRVRHTSRNHIKKAPRILKPLHGDRYLFTRLCHNGIAEMFATHRLVAKAFLPNDSSRCPTCQTAYEVNHKDQNPLNNRADNLEYVTHVENMRLARPKIRKASQKVLNDQKVIEIKRLLESGVSGVQISNQFGVSTSTICDIRKGRIWSSVSIPA